MSVPDNPAKFNPIVLNKIAVVLDEEVRDKNKKLKVLDPFAGLGGIHKLQELTRVTTTGVEIEKEWANAHPQTVLGDATQLTFKNQHFDAVATSPTFANRMADHHNARDKSKRHTYRHYLGRPLSENNAGQLQWGKDYRILHIKALKEMMRVVKPNGLIIINMSNHIRKEQEVLVTEWWIKTMIRLGLRIQAVYPIATQRMRQGANGESRTKHEFVLAFRN